MCCESGNAVLFDLYLNVGVGRYFVESDSLYGYDGYSVRDDYFYWLID